MQSKSPKLISSVYGEIISILLVYPGLATEQGNKEYNDIVKVFKQKGNVYRFRKEVHDFRLAFSNFRDRSRLEKERFRDLFNLEPGIDIISILRAWSSELSLVRKKGTMTFERWVQDPFLVLKWDQLTILLNSLHNQRMCDFFLPLEVAQQVGPSFLVKPTQLYLEGGNVLCGDNIAYVGKDLLKKNAVELEISDEQVVEKLRITLGVEEVISVGLRNETPCLDVNGGSIEVSWQPLFHIDVFMNLIGRGNAEKERIFFGNPRKCNEVLQSSENQGLVYSETEGRALAMFREVRDQLKKYDFKVIDIPIFFCSGRVFSWNNCLVEVTDLGSRTVYLPSYQTKVDYEKLNPTFSVLENYIEKLYCSHNFVVHWFRHGRFFRTIAEHGGSLHCIVKVLRREHYSGSLR